MENDKSNIGVGCMRGAVLALPLLFIIPITVWYEYTFLWGFLSFVIGAVILIYVMNSTKSLTVADVVLPLIISLVAAVIFAPISLLAGNFFSIVTCTLAGLMLSVALGLYKAGKLYGSFLILPILCFVYEILPIDLPTDIDNIIGLAANGVNIALSCIIKPVIGHVIDRNHNEVNKHLE